MGRAKLQRPEQNKRPAEWGMSAFEMKPATKARWLVKRPLNKRSRQEAR